MMNSMDNPDFKIGLISGYTQLVSCVLLYAWMDSAASAIFFPLLWLGLPPSIWTAASWAGVHLIDQDCEHRERSISRMESGYIAGICLAWICMGLAWIGVDLVYNKGENIPILLLVTVSLSVVIIAVVHLPNDTSLKPEQELELEEKESFV
jgi:hypothetical protein